MIEVWLIEEIGCPVGSGAPHQGRDGIDDQPKAILGFLDFFESLFQCLLCSIFSRNISNGPNKLDATRRASRGASHGMDIFHRAVRHHQSVFMVEILSVARRLIDGSLHGSAVVRMGALENKFYGWLRRLVTLEDSKGFV